MIYRFRSEDIKKSMFQGEAIILMWPRQVGKTTLISELLSEVPRDQIIAFNGDYLGDRRDIQVQSRADLEAIFGKYTYITIDEAQKIPNIGNILKSLVDVYGSKKQILVTWSSTLWLLDQTTEPLTGRKRVFSMFPIAFSELVVTYGERDARGKLEEILLYGSYPQVLNYTDREEKKNKLRDIVSGQLYRDILEFQEVKNPDILARLLELLALQIGSEVSYHSLAQVLWVSQQTVERYIDLLEKSFVLFRLQPFFTNKIKEVTKMKKIYFTDLGIRNTLIDSFQPMNLRIDTGALWENFFVLERHKQLLYSTWGRQHFWRTKLQEEVDLIEVSGQQIQAYECKWSPQSYRPPEAFTRSYPEIDVNLVHRDNYFGFLRGK